jgi:hypothetical protein
LIAAGVTDGRTLRVRLSRREMAVSDRICGLLRVAGQYGGESLRQMFGVGQRA